MTHIDAVAASPLAFASRNGMFFGGGEQFRFSEIRFYRLLINNAQTFKDWEPVTDPAQLDTVRKYYPYILNQLPAPPKKKGK
jgi:hypothetical protein